ncbi:MAG: biotin--[acetyl-CoA-carboxylase] ligase [Microvirga sp.]
MKRSGPRRHLAFDEVGSTNTLALEAGRAGDPGPLWVTAERQSAGRGRRGRAWSSGRGNLYASLLLRDPAPMADLANIPLVAAVGLRNGIAQLPGIDRDRVRIKWPNDILIGGAKTVGILIESEKPAGEPQLVVLGCGVNIAHWPDDAPYAVTGLHREGYRGTAAEAFAPLADGVEKALDLWDRGRGFASVRDQWLAHAVGLGQPCRINLPGGDVAEGLFEELDPMGRLVLARPGGRRQVFSAGDLFLLAAETASSPSAVSL